MRFDVVKHEKYAPNDITSPSNWVPALEVMLDGIGLMTLNFDLVKTAYRLFMAQNELIKTAIKFYEK